MAEARWPRGTTRGGQFRRVGNVTVAGPHKHKPRKVSAASREAAKMLLRNFRWRRS